MFAVFPICRFGQCSTRARRVKWLCAVCIPVVLVFALLLAGCSSGVQERKVLAERALVERAQAIAEELSAELAHIVRRVEALTLHADRLLDQRSTQLRPRTTYQTSPNGSLGKVHDDGGAGVWVSGVLPLTPARLATVATLEHLQSDLAELRAASPLVVQSYALTSDSVAFFSPFVDALALFTVNFDFREAVEPVRRLLQSDRPGLWLDAYVEPTGKGYVVGYCARASAFGLGQGQGQGQGLRQGQGQADSPLAVAVGVDLSVERLAERYCEAEDAPCLLVGADGTVLTANRAARELAVVPLGNMYYLQSAREEFRAPEHYRLGHTTDPGLKRLWESLGAPGPASMAVTVAGHEVLAHMAPVGTADWWVVLLQQGGQG